MSADKSRSDGPAPDGADNQSDHTTVATRFAEAEALTNRFVSVQDGEKACFDHDSRYSDPHDVPGTNYGVYADSNGPLVVLDIDDYRDDDIKSGMKALFDLPATFETGSPHGGTHRFYLVGCDSDRPAAEVLDSELGTQNPTPSWGEVQAANKYVVGAGSQLDECSKDWCDGCDDPDGGRYEVQNNQPVATVSAETLVGVLAADPDVGRDSNPDSAAERDETPTLRSDNSGSQSDDTSGSADFDEWLDDDLAEEALGYIDPDVSYPVWRNIGFALAEQFTSGTAKRLFKGWSRAGSKWDREAEQQAERIISDAGGGDVTPATLVHHAKEGGWEPPVGAQSIDELLSEHSGGDGPVPFWLLRQAALEFGVCGREALVEHETDDGETYLGFDQHTYNAVLRALDEQEIDHGRELIETDTRSPYYDLDLEEFADDGNPWMGPETMLRACLRAREAGAIGRFVAPPTMALIPLRRDVFGQPASQDMRQGTEQLLRDLYHDITVADLDELLADQ